MWRFFYFMATLQFSDTTTQLGLIQECEDYCNLGDTGISGNTSLLKKFTRYINQYNSVIWSWIFHSYGGWQYDDKNNTNLPQASDTLTSGTSVYGIPTGGIAVRGVEVLDSAGVVSKLIPITQEQIQEISPIGNFMTTSGVPRYYQMIGETIKLYPTPNYTKAAGIKVYVDRGSSAFSYTDTTKTPGFVGEFHEALSLGASCKWLKIHKPESSALPGYLKDLADYELAIKKFYSQRYAEMFPARITVRDAALEAK